MASTDIITQADLDSAGVTDTTLAARIVGLTVAEASAILKRIFNLTAISRAIASGGVVSYTLANQATTTSARDAQAILDMLDRMASDGGGGFSIPTSFV